ncbi:MAG: EamA family transporter, partial [Rhodobacteraceae bacterium]|nr:EamA family transporter [Paracoccaceae bacterium]
AFFIFGVLFSLIQTLRLISLLIGIFGLELYTLKTNVIDRVTLGLALMLAVITGLFVVIYTKYDTYGIRSTYHPFTFIFWLFLLDGFFMPLIAYMRWSLVSEKPNLSGLVGRGIIGGIIAYFSFGSIMLATRLDDVGQASVMRETSIIFAVLIGFLFLNENVGLLRLCLITLIAIGAIVVGVGA